MEKVVLCSRSGFMGADLGIGSRIMGADIGWVKVVEVEVKFKGGAGM